MTYEEGKGEEHLARHPLGRVPVLEDDNGRLLFESAAICLQIADTHPEAGLSPRRVRTSAGSSTSGPCSGPPSSSRR